MADILLDNVEKAGVANLVASMMNEGTKNKTPEELEDAIGLLGASIRVNAGNEDIDECKLNVEEFRKDSCPC